MTTSTALTHQARQEQSADLIRAATRSRRAPRPGRIRSTAPSRRGALARRLRLA